MTVNTGESVNIHEAKTQLSRLLERVERGDEITIARAGKPIARLVPVHAKSAGERRLGFLKGVFVVPDDFDEMMADEIEEMFYGSDNEP